MLSYTTEPFKSEARAEPLSVKTNHTDIDVLSGGVAKLFIKDCTMAY